VETVDLTADNVEVAKEVVAIKKHDIEDIENGMLVDVVTDCYLVGEKKPAVTATKEDSIAVAVNVKIEPEEKKRGGKKNKKDM